MEDCKKYKRISYICAVVLLVNFLILMHLMVQSIKQKDDHAENKESLTLINGKLNEWESAE